MVKWSDDWDRIWKEAVVISLFEVLIRLLTERLRRSMKIFIKIVVFRPTLKPIASWISVYSLTATLTCPIRIDQTTIYRAWDFWAPGLRLGANNVTVTDCASILRRKYRAVHTDLCPSEGDNLNGWIGFWIPDDGHSPRNWIRQMTFLSVWNVYYYHGSIVLCRALTALSVSW
jgi:hypothetical protein